MHLACVIKQEKFFDLPYFPGLDFAIQNHQMMSAMRDRPEKLTIRMFIVVSFLLD